MLDMLKTRGITSIFTSLTSSLDRVSQTDFGLSSLMDTWIFLVDIDSNGERNRGLYALKSRGMSHSNQIREYLVTDNGIRLMEPYLGADGVLTGSARLSKEAEERLKALQKREETARCLREIASRRATAERQIAELQAEIAAQNAEAARLTLQEEQRQTVLKTDRVAMGSSRGMHGNGEDKNPKTQRKQRQPLESQ
jgi:circadian clock protein KaiC